MKFFILISLLFAQNSFAAIPTDAQMVRIKKVMEATVQVQKLAKKAMDSQAPSFANEPSDEMLKKVNQADCKVVVTKPKEDPNGGEPTVKEGKVEILGEKCVLNLTAEIKAKKEGQDISYDMYVNFEAKADDLKKLIDVDRLTLKGPGYVKVVNTEKGMDADIQMTYGGVIHSQTEGDVGFDMKLNQQINIEVGGQNGMAVTQKMQIPMAVKFSDFSVATVSEVELSPSAQSEKYLVNGEVVTKEIYEQVTAGFKMYGTEEDEEE